MKELRDKVLIAERNDDFNNYCRIYNEIIEGRQGIEQERYLTITIERKNFEEAKAQFIGQLKEKGCLKNQAPQYIIYLESESDMTPICPQLNLYQI